MKRALKVILILTVIIAVSIIGYTRFAEARPPKQPDYTVVQVERGSIASKIAASGTIAPAKQINLTFKSTGRVTALYVEQGQRVQEGDLLAELETAALELSLEQAKSAWEISRIQLAQLEAGPSIGDIAAAKAAVASAQAAYDRAARGPSPEEIASARAALESAQAAFARLKRGPTEQEITIAKVNLEQARIALEQAQAAYDKVAWVGAVGALPQSLQLQQATIAYEAALANYQLATQGPTESQLKSAEAQVAQAQAALERLLESPSQSDLAVAEAQVVQAQANLDKLLNTPSEEQLRIARQQVRQAEIAVEQARLALDGARLVAPFDGIVARVNLRLNEFAPAGQPAIVLVDLSSFHVDVSIDEIDVVHVMEGQEAIITLDAIPDATFAGHVARVAPVASLETGIASYVVRVDIDQKDPRLRAGMTANVDIITARKENTLLVVNRAIRVERQTGRIYVERLENQKPMEVDVQLGIRSDTVSEVLSGLQEGDEVIIRGISSLERLQRTFGGSGFQR